jgi:universal stress protein F
MYSSILVAVDTDRPAASLEEALTVAGDLARRGSARLTLCTVVRDLDAELETQWSAIGYRELIDLARVRLREIASSVEGIAVEVEIGTGTVSGGILRIAEKVGADLIVVASHRPEAKDYLLGTNAVRVARRAGCSVLIAKGSGCAG